MPNLEQKKYPCGCVAHGLAGRIPNYCGLHGMSFENPVLVGEPYEPPSLVPIVPKAVKWLESWLGQPVESEGNTNPEEHHDQEERKYDPPNCPIATGNIIPDVDVATQLDAAPPAPEVATEENTVPETDHAEGQ